MLAAQEAYQVNDESFALSISFVTTRTSITTSLSSGAPAV